MTEIFAGRLAIQQRVLPGYRAAFFDLLADSCPCGLSVFAGQPQPEEQIPPGKLQRAQHWRAHNRHLFQVSSPGYLCWQPDILDWLQAWNPEALIVEANPRYPSTRQAIRWMKDRARPVLGWGLGSPTVSGLFASWRSRSRQRLLANLDGLIAYSRRGADEYQAVGFPPERIFVAPNAVASRPHQAPPAPRPIPVGQPLRLLFVGRLQSRKRIDLLLHACANLSGSLQPRLWIVGDGPARAEFETLAEEIYPPAEFVGARYGDELEDYYRQADLFVLPGTGGLAIQQAMSFGLPVVVAQGDGTQDDLVRPENGWQIPPNDLQAMKTTLQIALSNPAQLRQMGAASYRLVAEEINLEHMAATFIHAVNAIAQSHG